ncbi:hypothetical protein BDD14_1392 [Edaphobacter modestus]|uniref:Uncharacterized protein n=1 Tax=Edaphobacter modestus TaxID=388466 RepID=A0A4Q7YR79_9BACT|nr:hypothetical protein BDD14_1392 [Edaphobacter modestus]
MVNTKSSLLSIKGFRRRALERESVLTRGDYMNGMLLRSLGRYTEEVNADVQSVVLNLTGTNKLHHAT